jgi:hypothetical protein
MKTAIEWIKGIDEKWLMSADHVQRAVDLSDLSDVLIYCAAGAQIQDTKDLLEIYSPLRKGFDAYHKPDFVFINLRLKSVLCVGLGRKDRLFLFDADTYEFINDRHNSEIYKTFIDQDFGSDVEEIVNALEVYGEAYYDFACIPGNQDTVENALSHGADDDGNYHIDGDANDYELDEIELYITQYKDTGERMKNAGEVLNYYFADLEVYELATGDY